MLLLNTITSFNRACGQQQRTHRHRIFTQLRKLHLRAGPKNTGDEFRQCGGDSPTQNFTHERQASAQDNDLGMEEMHNVRERESKVESQRL